MQRLSKKTVSSASALPERVLQFGEGNFLRAFIDWMLHRMNECGLFNGRAVAVQPLEQGLVDQLNEQDGLYTLFLRGITGGRTVNSREVITSLSRGINPYTAWASFLDTAGNPAMRFVVSNTTEAGIVYQPTERPASCPASFPAKLTAWLEHRFKRLGGSADSGVVFLPCELINHNGAALKAAILQHADDWALSDSFVRWLDEDCLFLNTLVDRIVPGYPREEAAAMAVELGYDDRLLCAGEIFHLLVIEGPETLKQELPFHQAGLNVVWTDDLKPYRTLKVGLLNGAHTSSVLAAYLGGLDTVRDMVEDRDFARFVATLLFDEIVPALPMARSCAEDFAAAVLERFRNPFIRHELLSIGLNSVAKWKVRVLPSVKSYIALFGRAPRLLSFSLAALMAFYKGGLRTGYALQDDPTVLDAFARIWRSGEPDHTVKAVLSRMDFWGEDLSTLPGFEDAVQTAWDDILRQGTRAAVRKRIG